MYKFYFHFQKLLEIL